MKRIGSLIFAAVLGVAIWYGKRRETILKHTAKLLLAFAVAGCHKEAQRQYPNTKILAS